MNNSQGLLSLWTQGDNVTRFVALVLLVMSLASWSMILLKSLELWRLKRYASELSDFWHHNSLDLGIQALSQAEDNPFKSLVLVGQDALHHQEQAHPHPRHQLDLSEWVTRCLKAQLDATHAQMQSGLSWLASVGSTAPFVGLFGTVWGIYHALISIGSAGLATIDKVAGPVGEALIMTALGLAVAIPAVLGYNALIRGNKSVYNALNGFAHELHAFLITGARLQRLNRR
ncbi:MAG: MotA/TolQ/ExbB proton channel family protein [Betaproteobacteria bacterium]|nr:MotA/TolQ/ExbB proton channel family protein [Betaproteobacteria bacterium]NBY71156.1 MotA/TolQ/ExbB proton channel family protein [Betaproteobacteria bacterium]